MNLAEDELEDDVSILGGSAAASLALGGRHRPEELNTLAATTRFTRKEIQLIYRGFKQECPTGLVDEEAFKHIFSQFFPQGGESKRSPFKTFAYESLRKVKKKQIFVSSRVLQFQGTEKFRKIRKKN